MNNNYIEISVLTPVYNRQDCIGRCIESVMKQKYFQHIIVNDGSTDDTSSVIHNYMQKDKDMIKYIEYKENKGINYALNRGIENIKSGFVLILGSDDQLLDSAGEVINEYMSEYPGYKHYMFVPDDRKDYVANNKLINGKVTYVKYEDWLCDKISGDFVHVINLDVLKKYPYFEEFRMYELLNFLRLYKETQNQIIISEVIVTRDRNRKDALTKEGELFRKAAINNEYRYLNKLLELFGDDYKTIAPEKYLELIKRLIFLGLSLDRYDEVHEYNKYFSFLQKICYWLKLGLLLKIVVISYSYIKNKILK